MSKFARQDYPLQAPLPQIQRHDQLPPGAEAIGTFVDATDGPGYEKLYTFVKRDRYLSILISRTITPSNRPAHYLCKEFDFPLKVLSWFPQALEAFRKPPAAGGLPAGAIAGKDQDVDGEMLFVGNTTDGYDLTNRSRQDPSYGDDYHPLWLPLDWDLLYPGGLLEYWKQLGEKYEKGTL